MKRLLLVGVSIIFWPFVFGIAGYGFRIIYLPILFVCTLFYIFCAFKWFKLIVVKMLIISVGIGVSVFVGVVVESELLYKKLDTFDLNHDEVFSKSEITEEQQRYFRRVVDDSHLLFTYVVAFPYGILVSLLSALMFTIIKRLQRLKRKREAQGCLPPNFRIKN
jgi:hypothetical protein